MALRPAMDNNVKKDLYIQATKNAYMLRTSKVRFLFHQSWKFSCVHKYNENFIEFLEMLTYNDRAESIHGKKLKNSNWMCAR